MGDVTADLMVKVADDVIAAIKRTLAISPKPRLAVAMAAAGAALGPVAFELEAMAGKPGKWPDDRNVILAGLLAARMALDSRDDAIGKAYRDYAALEMAGHLRFDNVCCGWIDRIRHE